MVALGNYQGQRLKLRRRTDLMDLVVQDQALQPPELG